MRHSDFHIGTEFYSGAGRWRCTDVGARVIVAISLEPRTLVRVRHAAVENVREEVISDDPADLAGPPYMVVEHVFDEYSMEGCHETPDKLPDAGSAGNAENSYGHDGPT
jgi:hypothetical protein